MIFDHPVRAEDLPAGTVLRRLYLGEIVEVHVLDNCVKPGGRLTPAERRRRRWRYLYNGKRYATLTSIVRQVTGWRNYTGEKFFGLARAEYRRRDDETGADREAVRSATAGAAPHSR